jgi:predicted O-linked N-acetylglucosamine transferase (SPINDLY family)
MAPLSPQEMQRIQHALGQIQTAKERGLHSQAIAALQVLAQQYPALAELKGMLGDALFDEGRYEESVQAYQASVDQKADFLAGWNNLGNAFRALSRNLEAMHAYQQALKLDPGCARAWKNMGLAFQYENLTDEAVKCLDAAIQLDPENIALQWTHARALPIVYRSVPQLDRYRKRYTQLLETLEERVKAKPLPKPDAVWDAFHLHYQGHNDVALQATHGRLIDHVMAAAHPILHHALPPRCREPQQPLRVGFASSMLRDHTISYLFGSWIRGLAKRGVEVFGYLIGDSGDHVTNALATHCQAFRTLPNNPAMTGSTIRSDNLDVLIYPELGMNRHMLQLAALRLAPLQAVTWGHPVTTGLPNIDVFLSSEGMESLEAQNHYTEHLVRLPGLSLYLEEFARPTRTRTKQSFGLPENGVVYLIPQSLFKLLPQHDDLYPQIALRVPQAHFCFIANAAAQCTQGVLDTVRSRLEEAFRTRGLDPSHFLTFLPGLCREDFLSLNACSDIFLDAPGWSGGRTTLEAIGCGLLPITCEGVMMRQRHTAAILRELHLEELVAPDMESYVELAARLGNHSDWRQSIRQSLAQRTPKLLHRTDVIDALLHFCNHGHLQTGTVQTARQSTESSLDLVTHGK